METDRICPNCRKSLPPDVPLGLCPECLIKSGFPTGTEPGSGGIGRFVPPPVEEIAKLFPQFEILSLIGKGGMGAVYKARQPALDRFVALKVLPPAVANDPGFAERFNREARALARLSHPNIVVVYDFGNAGTLNYLVMEFVDGTNLREVEQAGKLSSEQALAIVPQICEALQFAHNEGIVHRDIKPENLLIDKKGRVKITDFGIAKILDIATGKVGLTGAKDVVGTPHYMAPEQIEKPQMVDHRADIYSLGVVFYEMLTGELPLGKFAPPSKKVQVDVRLDEVVLHTLEKEPERRYQQASQVKTDVETIAGTPPTIGAAAMAGAAPPFFPAPSQEATSDKILLPTFLLAFFFGVFGAHRFYVGKIGSGIAQLFTVGGLGIWATIDWILILCQVFTDGKGRRITNWWHPGPPKPPAPPIMPAPPIAGAAASGGGSHAMIIAPAVAVLVAGCLKLFSGLMILLFLQFGWSVGPLVASFGHVGVSILPVHWGAAFVFTTIVFSVVPAGFSVYGAMEMIRMRSYGWAIAAAIIAITSCNILGIGAGIWALIILLQPGVREMFATRRTPAAAETWPWILGIVAGGCLFIVLMIIFFAVLFRGPEAEPLAARATVSMQPPPPSLPPAYYSNTAKPAQSVQSLQEALKLDTLRLQILTNSANQLMLMALGNSSNDFIMAQKQIDDLQLQQMIKLQEQATRNLVQPVHKKNAGAELEELEKKLNLSSESLSRLQADIVPNATTATHSLGATQSKQSLLQSELFGDQLNLTNLERDYEFGIATSNDVEEAKGKIEILQAEITGDAVKIAQDQLNRYQHFFQYQEARYKNGVIPAADFKRAQDQFAVAQAQLNATEDALRQANIQTTMVPITVNYPVSATGTLQPSYQWYKTNAQTANFSVTATGTAPLTYQWNFDGFNQSSNVNIVITNEIHSSTVTVPSTNPPPKSGNDSDPPSDSKNQTLDIGDSTDFSKSFAVQPGGQLTMDVDRGDVQVTGGDQDTVGVNVKREVTDASSADATKILKEEHVTLKKKGDEISIAAQSPPSLNSFSHLLWRHPNLNVHYEITVPRNFTVESKTSGGNIKVTRVEGGVKITTMGGNLDCEDIGGAVDAHTMGGDVRAADCQGRLNLNTMGGGIAVDRFSGPDLQASTQGGSVSADFAAAPTADCELSTSGGNVIAHLPENAAVTVDAHTQGGSVSSDFPISTGHGFVNQSLQGPINGGGPKLKMETMGGIIEVLKRKNE